MKLSDKVELVEGSIEDKLRKNEFSESEVKSLFKWIDENIKSPHWMEVDGVSYDEAYIKLFHTSKNIDEFKTKYLELQQKYLVDFRDINSSQKIQKKTKKKLSNLYKQKVKTKKLTKIIIQEANL